MSPNIRRKFILLFIFISGLILLQQVNQTVRTTAQAANQAATGPQLWVTPLELDFGPVGVGSTSPIQAVTITNLGDTTLTNFSGGGIGSPFNVGQNCAGGVAPGNSCQYSFSFSPTAVGTFSATSSSYTNAGPFSIIVRGTGVGPEVTYSPRSIDFGSVDEGIVSPPQVVTIRNTGLALLTDFSGGGVSAPFSAGQNCAGGVAPGASCQYTFTFTPTAEGVITTTSNSFTNGGPISVALQGRGRTGIFTYGQRVNPRSIDFGPIGEGMTSNTIIVTITNQNSLASISNWAGGAVGAPFSASQNCAAGLPPGGSCQFSYTFSPTSSGEFSATSHVSNSSGGFSIALRGTGKGASFTVSPLWLDFGPVPLNTTSATQSVTIRNTGLIALDSWSGGSVGAPFSVSQNCAGGVPPGGSCQYFFTFTPTKEGQFTTYSSSSVNGKPLVIRLQGGDWVAVYLPVIVR